MAHPTAFDWSRAEVVSRRHLPHVRQLDAIYFVTFRTADSIPADVVRAWKERVAGETADGEDRGRRLRRMLERHLDNPQGECWLAEPRYCDLVAQTLLCGDRKRYWLDAYVAMPNHVHALLMAMVDEDLSRIVGDWKRYTAREINKSLGRTGKLWADESFDHIVRDQAALIRFREYILENPRKVPGRYTRSGLGSFGNVFGI